MQEAKKGTLAHSHSTNEDTNARQKRRYKTKKTKWYEAQAQNDTNGVKDADRDTDIEKKKHGEKCSIFLRNTFEDCWKLGAANCDDIHIWGHTITIRWSWPSADLFSSTILGGIELRNKSSPNGTPPPCRPFPLLVFTCLGINPSELFCGRKRGKTLYKLLREVWRLFGRLNFLVAALASCMGKETICQRSR
jgi:hypothetical protein